MTTGGIIFSIWVGILGFIAGLVVEVIVDHNELKETKAELEYTRKKLAELRKGLEETNTVEIIEITDNRTTTEPKDLFKPF